MDDDANRRQDRHQLHYSFPSAYNTNEELGGWNFVASYFVYLDYHYLPQDLNRFVTFSEGLIRLKAESQLSLGVAVSAAFWEMNARGFLEFFFLSQRGGQYCLFCCCKHNFEFDSYNTTHAEITGVLFVDGDRARGCGMKRVCQSRETPIHTIRSYRQFPVHFATVELTQE